MVKFLQALCTPSTFPNRFGSITQSCPNLLHVVAWDWTLQRFGICILRSPQIMLIVNLLQSVADLTCPSGYRLNPYTGNCFRFVSSPLSWSDARASCEAADEHLATFDTIEAAAWFRHQQLTGGKTHCTVLLWRLFQSGNCIWVSLNWMYMYMNILLLCVERQKKSKFKLSKIFFLLFPMWISELSYSKSFIHIS